MFIFGALSGVLIPIFIWVIFSNRESQVSESDEGHERFYTSRPFIAAILFSVVFLALSFAIESLFLRDPEYVSFFVDPKTYVAVFKEFFFASVIAVFIIATIEIFSRSEQDRFLKRATENAQKNVFQAVYQNSIDKEIFSEAEISIFQTDFVRTRHSREILLQSLAGYDDYILLTSTQEFRVRNVTKGPKNYAPVVYLPKPLSKFSKHVKISRVALYFVKDGQRSELYYEVLEGEEMDKALQTIQDCSPHELCFRFREKPVDPLEEVEVQISLTLVKEKFDNEIWTTLIPTLKAEVIVQSDIDDLSLSAIALHRGTKVANVQNNHKYRRWSVERPMLPFQGYVVSWSEAED